MKIYKLHSIAVFVVLAITGCASDPTYDEYVSTIAPIPSDSGRLFIYRLTNVADRVRPAVRIDGDPIDKAVPGSFFFVDLPPGDYKISAMRNTELVLSVELETGDEKYIRLDEEIGSASWRFTPVLVDAEKGKEQLKTTKYSGDVTATTVSPRVPQD